MQIVVPWNLEAEELERQSQCCFFFLFLFFVFCFFFIFLKRTGVQPIQPQTEIVIEQVTKMNDPLLPPMHTFRRS